MDDRLVWLLERFELRARVFHTGTLDCTVTFDTADDRGYLHLLRAGSIEVTGAAGRPAVVDVPSLLLYMSPTEHRFRPLGGDVDLVCASFEFGLGLRNPLVRALPGLLRLPLSETPDLAAALALLFGEAAEQHCGRQAVLDRLMEVVIVLLLRDLMDRRRLDVGLLAGLADARLMKAINAMHAAPERAWTLADLAAAAGMSRARFAERFREVVGMTPLAYLAEWRLGVAQSLLRRGRPVQFIADAVGYGSASALSRAFAARIGVSPTEWLRQHPS